MPTLDEALDQALGKHVSNPVITIDHTEKVMVLPQDFGKAGVRGDDNGRRIYFQMPNQMDEISSWSEHCYVEIQYRNARGETGRQFITGSELKDPDNNEYICSFLMPATLTKYEGEAEIQLCIRTMDGTKEWHISPVKILIGPFFDCEVITEDDPKYDIVSELIDKVARLEGIITGDQQISLADYLTKVEAEGKYLASTDAETTYARKTDIQKADYNEGYSVYGPTSISPLFDHECLLVCSSDNPADFEISINSTQEILSAGTNGQTIIRITPVSVNGTRHLLFESSSGDHACRTGTQSSYSIKIPDRVTVYVFTR